MTTTDLDLSLKMILDALPSEEDTPNHRQIQLTRKDFEMIASMIKVATTNQGCSIGFNEHQIEALKDTSADTIRAMKDMVKERKRILSAIGLATVSVMGWIGTVLFQSINWSKVGNFFMSLFVKPHG